MKCKKRILTNLLLAICYISSPAIMVAEAASHDTHANEHEHHHGDDGHADEHEHHHGDDGHADEHEHHHGDDDDSDENHHHEHE